MINEKPLDYGDAIYSLRPNSSWVVEDNDLDNVRWEDESESPPTKIEIEQELERLIQEKENTLNEKEQAKQSAINKLAQLGLTEEEAKAIIGV
jgi:DNA-directed RNA polymerase specialized sigma subunit